MLDSECTEADFEDSKLEDFSMDFFTFMFDGNFNEEDLISIQGWFWSKELVEVAIGVVRGWGRFLWMLG